MARAAAAEQVPMRYSKRGGARLGAGRPRKKDAGPPHAAREALTGREPVHASIRIRDEVWRLRSQRCFSIVCAALAGACNRPGFRIVGCSVQDSHLHLLIEAADARALARGMQSVAIRVAKGLNRLMGRRGQVFAKRYFARVLATPEEVRRTQRYVFCNRANHLARLGRKVPEGFRDPFTLGYFGPHTALPSGGPALVVEPRTWLLRVGWMRAACRVEALQTSSTGKPEPRLDAAVTPSPTAVVGAASRRIARCEPGQLALGFAAAA